MRLGDCFVSLHIRAVILPRNSQSHSQAENWHLRMANRESPSVVLDDRGLSMADMIATSKQLGIPFRIEVDRENAYIINNISEQTSLLKDIKFVCYELC